MDDFIGKKRGCPVQNNKVHQVISQELDDIRSQTGLIPIGLRSIKVFECCRIYVDGNINIMCPAKLILQTGTEEISQEDFIPAF